MGLGVAENEAVIKKQLEDDDKMDCQHSKVYRTDTLENPTQHPWICSKCLEEGIDIDQKPLTEYEILKIQKEKTAKIKCDFCKRGITDDNYVICDNKIYHDRCDSHLFVTARLLEMGLY